MKGLFPTAVSTLLYCFFRAHSSSRFLSRYSQIMIIYIVIIIIEPFHMTCYIVGSQVTVNRKSDDNLAHKDQKLSLTGTHLEWAPTTTHTPPTTQFSWKGLIDYTYRAPCFTSKQFPVGRVHRWRISLPPRILFEQNICNNIHPQQFSGCIWI